MKQGSSRSGLTPGRTIGNRRLLMWVGVGLVSAVIFGFWVVFLRNDLSRPSKPDTAFERVRTEIRSFFAKLRPFKPDLDTRTPEERSLDELRSRVFPDIKGGSSTTNGNGNTNEGETVNGNANP